MNVEHMLSQWQRAMRRTRLPSGLRGDGAGGRQGRRRCRRPAAVGAAGRLARDLRAGECLPQCITSQMRGMRRALEMLSVRKHAPFTLRCGHRGFVSMARALLHMRVEPQLAVCISVHSSDGSSVMAAQAWSAAQEVARAAGLPEGAPAADARRAGGMGGILEWAQLSWAAAGGHGAYTAAAALQRLPWAALPRLSGAALSHARLAVFNVSLYVCCKRRILRKGAACRRLSVLCASKGAWRLRPSPVCCRACGWCS